MNQSPNKVRLTKWIDALTSGQFRQTDGTLRRGGDGIYEHCCLGVACEIYRQETGQGRWMERGHEPSWWFVADEVSHGGTSDAVMPRPVMEWFGLDQQDPFLLDYGIEHAASGWNDTEGASFEDIARMVDATYIHPE